MVYFECQVCNESLKKPKVAKHLEICGSHYVSCIDCSKVFRWDEWEAHTSCMSEAQKYQGKLFTAKESSNKGQAKQDAWVDNVEKKIEDPNAGISPQVKALMVKLLGFNNIPRKQKPFANFVKNSLKIWNDKQIGEMWDVIFAANAKPPAPAAEAKDSSNEAKATPEAKEAEEAKGAKEADKPAAKEWAGWKRALDDELAAHDGELPWQKLRDALVAQYRASGQANGTSEEALNFQALAEIPEAYLSRDDALVRLPAPAKKQKKKQ